MSTGKVYIVGAGPGDPELITLKGVKCIREADAILYDRLVHPGLLEYAKDGAELIYCGKQPGYHAMRQETINHFLIKLALSGKTVTRLKGGDPFVFGRGGEEAEALAEQGIEFAVVPGVTSGIAAPAYAGIPLTHRDYGGSFAVVTGHRAEEQTEAHWEGLAKSVDTLVIYMGFSNLAAICSRLIAHGRSPGTPAALIHWGTTTEQQTVVGTLETIAGLAERMRIQNPSMIVIGEVVRLRDKLAWFEKSLPQNDFKMSSAR